jgi:hypothetical protein
MGKKSTCFFSFIVTENDTPDYIHEKIVQLLFMYSIEEEIITQKEVGDIAKKLYDWSEPLRIQKK